MDITKSRLINKISGPLYNATKPNQLKVYFAIYKNSTLSLKPLQAETEERVQHLLAKSTNLLTSLKLVNEELSHELLTRINVMKTQNHHGEAQ